MILEAIVLAGGKGTRLQSMVSDVPKPMAVIRGRPFLDYLLKWLELNAISRVILSVGYKGDIIQTHYGESYGVIKIDYCTEDLALGTGGAIKKALRLCRYLNPVVINGDTFFNIDLSVLRNHHINSSAEITIAVKEMRDFDRYGTVIVRDGIVVSFCEKKPTEHGYINAGIYSIKRDIFERFDLPDKFSFETDFLNSHSLKVCAAKFDDSFIDIGTPEDYLSAQELVPQLVAV